MKKCTSFVKQKGTRYIWGNDYLGFIIFIVFIVLKTAEKVSTKPCVRFLFICFAWEIKGFYQSSLGIEVDFKVVINVSPNILAKN